MLSKFNKKVQRLIIDDLGFKKFLGIQEKAIPYIMDGKNVLLIAPTASGKTEAFLLPVLNQIYDHKIKPTSLLYISPIKALINDQYLRFTKIGQRLNISTFKWHGDVDSHIRKKYLNKPTDILMITPESLEVLLFSKNYAHEEVFSDMNFVVIDEIHAFAGDERGVHLLSLLERINDISNYDIQRIGVSATIGNPDKMAKWLQGSSDQPVHPITDQGNRRKKVKLMYFPKKINQMKRHILAEAFNSKSLFFSNSRADTEKIHKLVNNSPIESYIHHSSIDKNIREKAEKRFKIATKNNMIIFCTSTLELGIDIGDLDKVLQLNPPYQVADFLQRIGRSGRKTNLANTVIYNTSPEHLIRGIAIINLVKEGYVEPIHFRQKAWDILFHQILAMVHQEFEITAENIFKILSRVYSFQGIKIDEFHYLINYMLETEFLNRYKGYLMVGSKAQKKFGYANYYNFYSVFENNKQYTVIYNHKPIGNLDSFYINTMDKSTINFYLAGQVWSIKSIDDKYLRVYVEPTRQGEVPFWMSGGSFIDCLLANEVYKVICTDIKYHFVNKKEMKIIEQKRKCYRKLGYELEKILIEEKDNVIKLHSYAGDKINLTLGLILKEELGVTKFTFQYNSIRLIFQNKSRKNIKHVKEILEAFRNRKIVFNPKLFNNILEELPLKRISKYYDYLPPLLQKELIADIFLDMKGSINYLDGKELIIKE